MNTVGAKTDVNDLMDLLVKKTGDKEKAQAILAKIISMPTNKNTKAILDFFTFSEDITEVLDYHTPKNLKNPPHRQKSHAGGKDPAAFPPSRAGDPEKGPLPSKLAPTGPLSVERIKELDGARRKSILLGLGRAGIMRALGFQAKIFKSSKEITQWANKEYDVKWLGKLNPKQISTMLWYTGDGARKIGKLVVELGKTDKDPAAIQLAIADIVTDAAKIVGARASKKRVKRLSEETEDKSYTAAEDMKFAKETIKDIEDALAQAKVPDDILVYRGMKTDMFSGDPEDFVGKIITNPGFTSTTLDKKVIIRNKPTDADFVIFEILVPEGSTGAYLSDEVSPGDHEMLLPRDSQFVVTGKRNKHVVDMLLL